MIELSENEFLEISNYIKTHYGVNLQKKKALIEGRLGFYISTKGYNNYSDYFQFAINEPSKQELTNMINRLTTNHTFFMREEDHFIFYKEKVLPWIQNELRTKDVRVWSAGCSTGQEPYTIAMTNLDYTSAHPGEWDTTVLASDISNQALTTAKTGVYTVDDISEIPDAWIKKYFEQIDPNHFRITRQLRTSVAFRSINLLDQFNFKKNFHSIFCRNVMIYFDVPTKTELIKKFHQAMEPGGYLFLGHSESLSTLEHDFTYVRPSVYIKA